MSSKFAKFATGVALSVILGVVTGLAPTAAVRAANAADDCLTEPSGSTTQGKHWYYHIERGTGRHCWYQRGQDDTAASTTAQDQDQDKSAAASDDTPSTTAPPAKTTALSTRDQAPPTKPAARKTDTPATRSIADARAEWPAQARVQDNSNTAPAAAAPVASPAQQTAANASVFPDPRSVLAAKPAPDPSSTAASDTDTQQDDTTASSSVPVAATPAPSPASATQAGPLANRHLGSIPTLLLVAFGALALAGLTGHTVYRLASVGRRVRPEDRWTRNVKLRSAPRPIPVRPEPIPEAVEDHYEDDIAPEEFADVEPEQFVRAPVERRPAARERFDLRVEVPRTDTGSADGNRKREQIEAHLAQLTRQLQADLKAAASAEAR